MIPKWTLRSNSNKQYAITSLFWEFQFAFDYNIDNILGKLETKPKIGDADLASGLCMIFFLFSETE